MLHQENDMSTTNRQEEERWPKLSPYSVNNRNAKDLALGIVEQAVQDWKDLCKKNPKKKLCQLEIAKRKCMFDQLRRWFQGDWCGQLCGNSIRRNMMVEELERMYQNSGFMKQDNAMDSGEMSC